MKYPTMILIGILLGPTLVVAEPPESIQAWLDAKQNWERDTDGPIISLGEAGEFDDTHIFAPAVVRKPYDGYQLWYCGSTNTVAKRVFRLGMATSPNGREFRKHQFPSVKSVMAFADNKRSILTPSVLRDASGFPINERGALRMWFSATDFEDPTGKHTLHYATSADGITWSNPSDELLPHCYAPCVLRVGDHLEMWFSDVSKDPWIVRHAISEDGEKGRKWRVTEPPCLVVDQAWERSRLFYPHVIRIDDAYLMWYGSYWSEYPGKTALGLAVSADGKTWHKSPNNPVHRPEVKRPWESHYVTSHTIIRQDDGSLRMWYASRKAPPHINKYFALNTAVWRTPPSLVRRATEK